MDRTLKCDHWKAVEKFFTVVLFVFQFYLLCYFGKFNNFDLGTGRRRVRHDAKTANGCMFFMMDEL